MTTNWAIKPLGSIIRLEYGAPLPANARTGEGFPVIGSNGEVGRHKVPYVKRPGIVIGRKGTVGAVTWSSEAFWPIDTTYYVEPLEDLDERWCFWLLSSLPLNRLDSSTGVPGLNRNDAYAIEIPVPPLPEQRRIVEILDTVDEAIRQTEALISKLKEMKQGLLHDLLTRGLDENGELRDPVARPDLFKDSPLGRIPRGWEARRLGSLCTLLNGLAFKPQDWAEGGLPIIRIQNLNGSSDFNYFDGRVREDYVIPPGTLLFSWSGSRGTSFGPFIWSGPVGVLNQHIFRVTPVGGIRKHWFYYALDDIRKRVERHAHGGSGLVHIRRRDLENYLIATPSEPEQERIESALSAYDDCIRREDAYLEKLRLLKRGMMQDLLTGRVRVRVPDTTPEPVEAST